VEQQFNRVSVIGLGYIGLPTAAVLAGRGLEVIGVDVLKRVVDRLNRGEIHIVEPDLAATVRTAVEAGRLRATAVPEPADAFVIAVPTPFHDDRSPDLTFVEAACRSIAPVLTRGNLVILESTSPVGTTDRMCEWLAAARPDLSFPGQGAHACDVHVAYCPERVLPGNILRELVENTRIVGGMTPACAQRAKAFYATFVSGECMLTDARTAELCKLTENAYRDVNIAFANELSLICDRLGIDVWSLIALANKHPRVKILSPGPGVGGHCIAVDPWFIVHSAPEESRLIRAAREVNDGKPSWVLEQMRAAADRFKSPRVACLGLSYKPDIDDLRESPALHIVEAYARLGLGPVLVVEPHVGELPAALGACANASLVDLRTALESTDILVGLVAHRAFRSIDREALLGKIVIDACGMWR
jgi:UDP-N-acetyl-D-mannosaminuronic acid dehydrogenase